MSKMSDIDYTIQEIKHWIKEHISYIVVTIILVIIAILVHGQADRDIKRAVEKENRLDRIEKMLQEYVNRELRRKQNVWIFWGNDRKNRS